MKAAQRSILLVAFSSHGDEGSIEEISMVFLLSPFLLQLIRISLQYIEKGLKAEVQYFISEMSSAVCVGFTFLTFLLGLYCCQRYLKKKI